MDETNENQATSETTLRAVRWTPGTTRVLKVILNLSGGSKLTVNIKYPKTGLTKLAVQTLFNSMISDGFWIYNDNEAVSVSDLYIYETTYTAIGA